MTTFTTSTCFGCGAPVAEEGGNFYCAECIAKQAEAQQAEAEAFDAFHAFADRVAKVTK